MYWKWRRRDKKLAESWQVDADGILISVRLYLVVPCLKPTHNASFVDRFILCYHCIVDLYVDPGHSAKLTGYVQLLPSNIYMATVTDSNRSNISTSLPKKAALKSSPEIDARALMWTFDSSGEDQELECFFSGLTGFHGSKMLKEPLHYLIDRQKPRLLEAVITLWDRSFLFNVLPDRVKFQRASICAGVVDLVVFPGAFPCISSRLVSGDLYRPMQSTEVVCLSSDTGVNLAAKVRL